MIDLSGEWRFELTFLRGDAQHSATLAQDGEQVSGTYRSQYGEQDVSGHVQGDAVHLRTAVRHQACGAGYGFTGVLTEDGMAGEVELGEYWTAAWKASRVS